MTMINNAKYSMIQELAFYTVLILLPSLPIQTQPKQFWHWVHN